METLAVNEMINILPYFIKHPNLWSNYDQKADVLYVHFKKPNTADNSEMVNEDTILRYENENIIGITLTNASKYHS
ncbi:MAG: DUF2283 domain-containing protein [Cytophagales bacterium]